jgi:hypothetical protein
MTRVIELDEFAGVVPTVPESENASAATCHIVDRIDRIVATPRTAAKSSWATPSSRMAVPGWSPGGMRGIIAPCR